MRFDVFSLLPDVLRPYLEASILQRAVQNGLLEVNLHDIRAWTTDKHHITDDAPYGGGGGMVMKPQPIFAAVEGVLGSPPDCPVILMTPQGRVFTQQVAFELAQHAHIALLCGRYEGIDERVRQHLVTDEISIGDFVLTGGELPALILIDALTRLIPGALGDPDGAMDDSHASGLLEYPHYTRPPEFRGWGVPEVLLSGNHAEIARWRRAQALERTWRRRPDMLARLTLSESDRKVLARLEAEQGAADGADDNEPTLTTGIS
ncbi:tRNA (guanosine(37)-N1)-methyltransferase TrmD [Levilinea saccharolytica]|uniref:tRNA (guanine-N(1)-)-methyltransferase n=1 Tax=Levilinea saccharolytica TaxID=229921 RepID=A0A0P6XCP1_9CHLR|nr:tRNA (guanosine(37)-N1)-methyltransferase TrmD [Levilinea saccharolytica]KPL80648.1 tRNA (guanine-N1)-methyltransferase [Levilinea saccharolytica]GAP17304.1 tRNA (Guanine37-N(1)-) methyltransferase [Levilinea saccharolytica]